MEGSEGRPSGDESRIKRFGKDVIRALRRDTPAFKGSDEDPIANAIQSGVDTVRAKREVRRDIDEITRHANGGNDSGSSSSEK